MKKILSFIIICLCVNILYAGPRKVTRQETNAVKFDSFKMTLVGDAVVYKKVGAVEKNTITPAYRHTNNSLGPNFTRTVKTGYGVNTLTFSPIGLTAYTLQSNGTPFEMWQDFNATPAGNNIHCVFTYSPNPDPAPGFTARLVKYYFSSNAGSSWAFVSDVPPGIRAGFPSIVTTSDGNALIIDHTALTSTGATRCVVFYDTYPGLGSFNSLDIGTRPANQLTWGVIAPTQSISLTNKFVIVASLNQTGANADSAFWNTSTSLSTPGTFLGNHYFPSSTAENYTIAKSGDGSKIGIAYIASSYAATPEDPTYGSVNFMESTDNGTTFASPTEIFHANWGSGDSVCAFNGIALIYNGNVAKVVWEACKQTRQGNFYPGYPSQIRYWSSDLSGSDPNRSVTIADTNNVGYHPYYHGGPATQVDGFTNTTRPTIGKSNTGNVLFVAFMVPSDYIGNAPDTVSYMDIYYMYSPNNGSSWVTPVKLNPVTPVRDWSFPSVSPNNLNSGNNYVFHLGCESDSLPGDYSTYTNNIQTNATYYYVNIAVQVIGINNISNEIPDNFSLAQNYPNPFNPSTSIRFSLPKVSDVTVKIYNVNGQLVSELLNNVRVLPGTHEVKFDASNLSSGLYFYTISTADFKDTKKMMLIK